MTKQKSTKKTLLTSVLSLILCMAMLIGTTFAWFTDSVSSTNNIIKSGNLDVNLYYWDNSMATGTNVSIQEKPDTKLFKNVDGEDILWEPGATGFGQFEVANEGSLALRYQLKLNFYNATETAPGSGKTLADVLSVYAVARKGNTGSDDVMEDDNLESLRANGIDAYVPGYEAQPLNDFVLEGYLLPGESFRYELGTFWEPTANDNDYNVKGGLSIDFGVTLLATQMTCEKDSYDDQYDVNAKYDRDIWDGKTVTTPVADAEGVYHIFTADELVGMMSDSKYPNCNKYQNVVLENNIDLAGMTVSGFGDESGFFDGIFDGQGYTISNFKIDATDRTYYAGLFNQVSQYSGENTVIKNLTVVNATISGTSQVGAIVGGMNGNTIVENCKVLNCELFAVKKVGTVVGYTAGGTVKDCYAENCTVLYSEKEGAEILGYENTGSTVSGNTSKNVAVAAYVTDAAGLANVVSKGATNIVLADGEYDVYGCAGKTLTISGTENAVITPVNEGEWGCDYGFDSATVTFNGVTIDTTGMVTNSAGQTPNYPGFARINATYNNCIFNGTYAMNKAASFTDCTFNVTGDKYNLWTWGADKGTFTECTFNCDGKSVLVYNSNCDLTFTRCTFNDNGTISDKAAIETGADYGPKTYNIILSECNVNGFDENSKGTAYKNIVGNKNNLTNDYLNVVVDGVDVY